MKKVRVGLLAVGLLAVGLLSGCSSMRVVTDYSEAADFTQFKTFQYKNTDTTVEGSNPLVHTRIVEALRREMTAAGLTEVESDPDVYISYYGSTSQQVVFNTTHMGYGWGTSSWHRSGMSMTSSRTTASTFTSGTLVIDIWDARAKELVWRGEVTDSLSNNPNQNADRINRGIVNALAQFPPR